MTDTALKERLDLVRKHTIYEVIHGSHAYGMNTPTSDMDKKGICLIPDDNLYFGGETFEQQDSGWTDEKGNKEDKVVYSLSKFMGLATDCNPNIIEVLFADPSDILVMTEAGKLLRDNRRMFLSTKARHKFTGYAVSQLKRIETHKRWIDNPPPQPKLADFVHDKEFYIGPLGTQLPDGMKVKKIEPAAPPPYDWPADIATLMVGGLRMWFENFYRRHIRHPEKGMWFKITAEVYDKSGHESKKKDWDNYVTWKKNRNPARAVLEEKSGYDTKHAAHLVRLLRMGYEIMNLGEVIVKRPDAKELLSIRNGAWSFEQIIEYAQEMNAKIEEAEKTSKLPRSPDFKAIKALQIALTKSALKTAGSF